MLIKLSILIRVNLLEIRECFSGDALISWKSKKQDHVSKSNIKAKYRASSTAYSEFILLHGILDELGFP